MKVLLETSPLRNANAVRGVGVYTRFLSIELEKLENKSQEFFTSEDLGFEQINAMMSKRGIDIIHYPYFDLFQQTLPLPLVKKILGRARQKVVVTIHDVIPLLYPNHYPVGVKGTVGFLLQKEALRGVAAVITDSETSKRDISKYLGIQSSKIVSIPLAGNPEIRKATAAQVSSTVSRYHLPESYILYVGDINYNKNIPELLKAVSALDKSIHLVCVGVNFKPQAIPEWQAIETTLHPVKDRVHFITSIDKKDTSTLSDLYTGAKVYVQPSLYEGFGLPLLEAMQCETLLVSSNTPALKEIGGKGVEFVEPTAQALAQGITRVLRLSNAEKEIKREQNKKTLTRFSWQKAAQDTVNVYRSIL